IDVHPDRSPFMRERIEVLYEGEHYEDIIKQVHAIDVQNQTFRVQFVKMNDLAPEQKITYDEQRKIERDIGMQIEGEADVRGPDLIFGIVTLGGRWYFGPYIKARAVWLEH